MSISRLAGSIAPSPTLALNEQARQMREHGDPVINLGIGEPKNRAPSSAISSTSKFLETGEIKYTPTQGTTALKDAIIRYTEENYQRLVSRENVIVSSGAKQSLFNILFSLLNQGDEVLLLAPYWVSYPEMVKMCAGTPVVVMPEPGSFVPSFNAIMEAVTVRTKAIILNSPNNPSGAVFPADLIARIVELCENKDIFLIADDIYHKLVFDGNRAVPAYEFTKKSVEDSRVVVVNGISKMYGMTGFRIGWVVANKQLVEVMANVQSQITSCTSGLLQAAAVGALMGNQSIIDELRLIFEHNRDATFEGLNALNGIRLVKPEGTFYILPNFKAFSHDSVGLAKHILNKAFVVTVPGKEFGLEGYLRLSYAGVLNDIIEAVDRIKWVLDPDAPSEIVMGERTHKRDWL